MPGEFKNQLSLTRAALSTRGAQKQIPINSIINFIANMNRDYGLATFKGAEPP